MRTLRLLTFVALMSATAIPWALAQDQVGAGPLNTPGRPSSISEGSYGTGFYGPGLTGPGSSGPGSYGPGSYNEGVGAATTGSTPFSVISEGGAAAGTPAAPSARAK